MNILHLFGKNIKKRMQTLWIVIEIEIEIEIDMIVLLFIVALSKFITTKMVFHVS